MITNKPDSRDSFLLYQLRSLDDDERAKVARFIRTLERRVRFQKQLDALILTMGLIITQCFGPRR